MDTAITIAEFNALLQSGKDENPLVAALRKLLVIEQPEDFLKATSIDGALSWGW